MTDRPASLPYCAYPTAADRDRHGIQPLLDELRSLDLAAAAPYRSARYVVTPATDLTPGQLLGLASAVGHSFARRDGLSRHPRPPDVPPPGLLDAVHQDPLGTSQFGSWDRSQLIYWFIRLFCLTDPTSPRSSIRLNDDILAQSIAITDPAGRVIGAAVNETMRAPDADVAIRDDDPFIDAVLGSYLAPILKLLGQQEAEALTALGGRYPQFADALSAGRVGHHFMVARSDALLRDDTFELVAATMERYGDHGFAYVVVEATKQWTGAACEALGGIPVHFAPFRAEATVPLDNRDAVTSPDGFVSDKDSGSMFYVLRLA